MKLFSLSLAVALIGTLSSCNQIPKDLLRSKAPTLEIRRMQMRKFDSGDEKSVLMACGGLLQDLGFNITESDVSSGLIVGQKDRSAVEAGQVVAKVAFAILGGNLQIDKNQRIKASVVTRPIDSKSTAVRVTFQRLVFNEMNLQTRAEALSDPAQYQEFFDKLSKSLFLNAHNLE